MAVAVSQIPLSLGGSHHSTDKPPFRSSTAGTMTSPLVGVSRKAPSPQQHFGRYQNGRSGGNDDGTNRNSSSISLEALAAFLTSEQGDEGAISPPVRSKGFYTYSTASLDTFHKSKSFPEMTRRAIKSSIHSANRPKVVRSRSVRFADSTGLPLEHVRPLTAADPFQTEGEIVASLDNDLGSVSLTQDIISYTPSLDNTQKTQHTRTFKFPQPGTQPDFYQKLHKQNVCLESVKSETRAVHGIIRVMNISYNKEVCVRWTHDNWRTHHDTSCLYCPGSSDGKTDRFSFTIPANGDDIQFALRYKVQREEFWDNNSDRNYVILVDNNK